MPDNAPLASHVFVSYASHDQDRVAPIVAALHEAGLRTWVDQTGIPGGVSYGPEIAGAIKASGAVLLMCSTAAFASRNVRQEIQLAWKHERPILPLRLDAVELPDDLEYWLEGCQWIEVLARSRDEWLPELTRALARFHVGSDQTASSPAPPVKRHVNLPTPLTALLGRDTDVRAVAELLTTRRLVTLTGPGGVGKTRLAIEAARSALAAFPDGVDFVDMSSVTEADLALPAIARALGLSDAPGTTIATSLAAIVGEHHRLLVLDNMEQIPEAASEIAELLVRCPNLAMLVTSRAPFSVRGEHVVPVEPLRVPGGGTSVDEIATLPAVILFAERAAAAQPGFAVTSDNAQVIGEICARLDGLPLAIELAAARVALFSPAQLLARLDRRLASLGSAPRDMPNRQRTLRDAIAWSHDLLSPEEQALFRRLAIFPGGCSLDAAEIVCDPDGAIDAVSGLTSLVDKSLIRRDQAGEARRYRMLETVHEFAQEQLTAGGEEDALRERLADWGVNVFASRYELVRRNPESAHVGEVAVEYLNLRDVLLWLERAGRADDLLRLTASMFLHWYFTGLSREGRDWCNRALAIGQTASPVLRAHVLMQLGLHSHYLADDDIALRALSEVRELAHELGDRGLEAETNYMLGIVMEDGGNHDEARALCQKALDLFETLDEPWGQTAALYHLGIQHFAMGDRDEALSVWRRAADAAHGHGFRNVACWCLSWIALAQADQGEHLAAAHTIQDHFQVSPETGLQHRNATFLAIVSFVAAEFGENTAAAGLLGAVQRAQTVDGTRFGSPEDALFLRSEGMVRGALGEEAFATAFARGQALSAEDALTEAKTVVAVCLAVE